jgi:hypothetical protein
MDNSMCPICHLEPPDLQVVEERDYGEQIVYNCARCGKFLITRSASAEVERLGEPFRVRLSAWVRMQNDFGMRMPDMRMSNGSLENVKENLPTYTPNQKQCILLRLLARKSEHPGSHVHFITHFDYPLAWAQNEREVIFYLKALIEMNFVKITDQSTLEDDWAMSLGVTSKGWQHLDQNPASDDLPWETIPVPPSLSKETKGKSSVLSAASISSVRKLLYSQSRGQIKQVLLEAGVSPEKILPIQVTNDMRSSKYLSKEEIIQKMFDPIYGDNEKAAADEILIKLVQVLREKGVDVSEALERLRKDGVPTSIEEKKAKRTGAQIDDVDPFWEFGGGTVSNPPHKHEYDVFICHASEDKEKVVEPLARLLKGRGKRVWLDKFVLRIGDSLLGKIDEGLAKSRYGIVVLSPSFFKKPWPKRELDGLMQKETGNTKVILPIWHELSAEDVIKHSPILAGKLAGTTGKGLKALVDDLLSAMID